MDNEFLKSVWPDWEIEKRLGKGAYGEVYKVGRHDSNVDSYAAIKVITIPNDESEVESLKADGFDLDNTKHYFQNIVDDFVNEIKMMESLKGVPNIVSVEDYKVVPRQEGIGWDILIRMELLTPFNEFIQDHSLMEKDVIRLGIDICSALEICGQKGIIHRDIKPENIFLNEYGNYKLGDFGIARKLENTTGGLSQKGTFNYMAPEVASGGEYDARVDIYSLGIVLYRLLNENRLPFLDTDAKLMNPNERKIAVERRLKGEALPVPTKASPAMANLILRACSFNRNNRFPTATDMKNALLAVMTGSYVSIPIVADDKTEVILPSPDDKTVALANNMNAAPVNSTFGQAPAKKKSPLPIIIGIVAGLLIFGVGGFFAAKFFAGKNENSKKNEKEIASVSEEESAEEISDSDVSDEEKEAIQAKLDEAEEYASKDDYKKAIEILEGAQKTYPDSELIKNRLAEYTEALAKQQKTIAMNEAADLAANGDYKGARDRIKEAMDEYGEDDEYTKKYDEYNKKYVAEVKAEALTKATEYEEAGDYVNAYKALKEASKEIGQDSDVDGKMTEYENKIVSDALTQADAAMAERKYSEAIRIVEDALTTLPGNQTLNDKKVEIENSKPVSITTLTPLNGGFDWNEGDPTDPFGNTYSDVSNYAIFKSTYSWTDQGGYEEYRLYGDYKTLSASIAPQADIVVAGKGQIQVYADDKLVYTSPVVNRKTDSFSFEVDITGAEYVKIVYTVFAHSGTDNTLILMDVNLWK
ncbi:MAG: protein kinase [Lachnospiraceae bacterium]|nr:protein kinase [Lachnospiraceae bacterium]